MTWGKGNTQLQSTLTILPHLWGCRELETLVKFMVQEDRFIVRLRHNHRTEEHLPALLTLSPHYLRHIYSSSFYLPHRVLVTRKKMTRHNKRQKVQFEETEQTSEPDKAGTLELWDQKLKTPMINILRALMDRVDSMQQQTGNESRDGNPKKESKRNAGDNKTMK